MIKVVVAEQKLYHHRSTGVVCVYPISTSSQGVGNAEGSLKTPLGKHRVYAKIGEGVEKYTAFSGRKVMGLFSEAVKHQRQDWILSRILWLEGLQTGINRRGKCDSRQRYIYIHGTDEEDLIGQPASHGCVRMRNDDVIDLFGHVSCGEVVLIK